MTFEAFEDLFYKRLKEAFEPQGTSITKSTIDKNNETLSCLILRRDFSGIGITIYPKDFYEMWENGALMEELMLNIKENIMTKQIPEFDIHQLYKEGAEKKLVSCVVGYEKNKEWLANIPHERIQDMALFARWEISDEASFKITNEVLGNMRMTKEEMLAIAKENRKLTAFLSPMEDVLFHLMDPADITEKFTGSFDREMVNRTTHHLYILGSSKPTNGAAVAMDPEILNAVHNCFDDDFYLLPSSIHETLVIPKSTWDHGVDALRKMVCDVNGSDVPLQDQLTDNVYEYDGRSLKMAGVSEKITVGVSMEHHARRR